MSAINHSTTSDSTFAIDPKGSTPQGSTAFFLLKLTLVASWLIALLVALHPGLRSSARALLIKDERRVVSTATGDLVGDGSLFTVVKVKTQTGLFLEVYNSLADGGLVFLERVKLNDRQDAFFNFSGQLANLAITDIDGDGRSEVLAPGFDDNLVGRLHVYRFDSSSQRVERVLL
jgi:hypothetical protein